MHIPAQREPRFDPLTEPKVSIYQPEQPGRIFPGVPRFTSHAEHRRHLKERLVGACRAFSPPGLD